ncbi:hypothetical protein C8F04DRAFT_955246, partial [Mycena alexandri]
PATFFSPGGQFGVCGFAIQNTDLVAALSPEKFANGAHCGTVFTVESTGVSVAVEVGDECVTCSGNELDLTPSAFERLAPLTHPIKQNIHICEKVF